MSGYFFDLEDAPELEGEPYCPKCGCCMLKQYPKTFPTIFEQVALYEKGEEWKPEPEDLGWICSGGCTTTHRHN
jgi:hypothetical protein